MKKQVFKRKKLGMALILTLMVSVVAVAIASSYIGMVGAHSKAARSYTKEAMALSLAKTGLNATLNAMGVPRNWATEADTFINTFNLAGAEAEGCLHISNIEHNPNHIEGMLRTMTDGLDGFVTVGNLTSANESLWFGNNFDFLTQDATHVQVYKTTGEIPVSENLSGALVIAVTPEFVNLVNGLPRNNVNYAVGVAALIFERGHVPANLNETCFNSLLSSRVVKYRVSNVFPGSMYQNMAAADYPGTNHAADGHFGYPNWTEMTADAAFMDENTQWDGAMSIDGAKANNNVNDSSTTWGASMTGNNFDPENIEGYLAGNSSVDTSGFLKISLLNRNTDITAVDDNTDDKLLPKIAKQATAEKILVYSNLVDNSKTSFQENNMGNARNKITNNNIPEERAKGTNFRSIWNRTTADGEMSLLSGIDGDGNALDGSYRQLKTNSGADIRSAVEGNVNGYINYTAADYQPDPMYGNETMEVPTVRITIRQNATGNDEYLVQRIGYVPDTNNPPNATGWVEQVMEDTVLEYDNIDGMIYVGGANVQVRGTASRSVSIVSDVNSVVEHENYQVEHGGMGAHFNRNLNSPNVKTGNTLSYIDAGLNETNGTWEATDWTGTGLSDEGANNLISTVNDATAYETVNNNYRLNTNGGSYVFPTYGADEQPSGNITVIGDLNSVEGTNPVVGLIAKNRVLLNDFGHTIENSQNPSWEDRDSAHDLIPANAEGDAAGDGILTVKAVVASETHNMCFDFNNVSKNLDYIQHENTTHHEVYRFTGRDWAPGNHGDPGQGATGFNNDKTNYGMLLNNNLATRLGLNTNDNMVSDDGNGNATYYLNKYSRLLPSAKRMIWSDVFCGAVRPDWNGVPVDFRFDPQFFSNGTLNFHGMIISRFGDINADAGVRDNVTGGRRDQLGYVNQFINFDTNLQDNSAPYFSTASQIFNASSSFINWNVLSYVDKGSFNLNKTN